MELHNLKSYVFNPTEYTNKIWNIPVVYTVDYIIDLPGKEEGDGGACHVLAVPHFI